MKKRILILTTISGFLPKFLMNQVRVLQAMGYEVHYASNFDCPIYECDRNLLETEGIRCHHLPIAKSPFKVKQNREALKQLRDLMQKEEIHVLHCNNPVGGLLGRRVGKNIYTIYTAHGLHFYKGAPLKNWLLYYPVEKALARKTDLLITINKEDYVRAKKFSVRQQDGIFQIPGVGVNRERFSPNRVNKEKIRQELGIKSEAVVFLSVGELNQNKNHRVLLRAFTDVQKNCPEAVLYICGEGNKRAELEQYIAEHQLAERVKLCGYQQQIEKYYQAADIFFFPSYREGLGMASLEAMSTGLPVVVADNRGTREYTGENGIVCDPKKKDDFARAMIKLYRDESLRKQMGEESKRIADAFSIEESTEVMRSVYHRMDQDVSGLT